VRLSAKQLGERKESTTITEKELDVKQLSLDRVAQAQQEVRRCRIYQPVDCGCKRLECAAVPAATCNGDDGKADKTAMQGIETAKKKESDKTAGAVGAATA
jgi:hypothetical protein